MWTGQDAELKAKKYGENPLKTLITAHNWYLS
jgi:hypothetical protein